MNPTSYARTAILNTLPTLRFALAVSLLTAAFVFPSKAQTTYTVNSTVDPGDGVCDATECTLREAVDAANDGSGLPADRIEFDISGPAPHTIVLAPFDPMTGIGGELDVSDPVVIDGYTEPGATPATASSPANILIEVDGQNLVFGSSAFFFMGTVSYADCPSSGFPRRRLSDSASR